MDSAAIDRLEESFALLAPRGQELVDRFYTALFAKAPGVRGLFPVDLSGQKQKLLASIVLVARNLRTPEKLRDALVEMGTRHAGYGAEPAHYPVVRDTLVETMAAMAGTAWTPQLTQDWSAAIDQVAAIMLEGHALASAS